MDNEKLHDEIIMAQSKNNTSLLKNLIKKKDAAEANEIKELGESHSWMLYNQNSSSFPIYQATQLIISDL